MVFAHQGGWDEIVMVAAPVALFAGLLWMANRRADAAVDAKSEAGSGGDTADPVEPSESS